MIGAESPPDRVRGEGVAEECVPGERHAPMEDRFTPAGSRVRHAVAIALVSLVGLGLLTWYYAHAAIRHDPAQGTAQAAVSERFQGDVPLPGLGRIDPPARVDRPDAPPADRSPPERPPPEAMLTEIPVEPNTPSMTPGTPPAKSAAEIALERELSGTVFASHRVVPESVAAVPGDSSTASGDARTTFGPAGAELGTWLRSGVAASVRAHRLPDQRLLLAKGAFIDCTLETAIDSTLPGMTTCVMASDTFGVDGNVVLMERGTKLIGETRGQMPQGSARVFVLWTEARTPTGVVVPLDSPGADELGRSGLPGDVNRHFWQRFGAAMLVSVIDGAVQSAVQSSRGSSGTVVVNPSASQDVLTEILKSTVSIPPTVIKRNGDRIQVLVARDLDFRSVYELRTATAR